jgi:hypothetical protein
MMEYIGNFDFDVSRDHGRKHLGWVEIMTTKKMGPHRQRSRRG